MSIMRIVFLVCFSFNVVIAQKIDNTASFREISDNNYFRVNYDNDLFAFQDENYTQGFSFELVAPFLSKNPINSLFLHFKNDNRKAGLALEHNGFTPNHYELSEIQGGDRPFAATAFLKSFSISTDKESHQRIASHLSFGIMGPAAQGKEIQTGIHRVTGSSMPQGWGNQIANHFIVNYGIDYEKKLLKPNKLFGIASNASVKIGNLFSNASIGFNTTFGLINNPSENSRQFKVYFYIQPIVTAVAYDGTMQGGFFRDKSVYTIPTSDINRLVGQINYGIILQTKYIYFEYYRTDITKEIKTLSPAAWGGIKVGFSGWSKH